MNFSVYQASQIGNRKFNQDRVAHAYNRDVLLLVLADGMGGHLHGEMAAEIAIETFIDAFESTAPSGIADAQMFLADTMELAHKRILQLPHVGQAAAPGTTCVAAIVKDDKLYYGYAGDSRLYLVRQNELICKTRDHSLVQQWVEWGKLTPDQARVHPQRNQITNCLGGIEDMFYMEHGLPMALQSGDVLLMGSDGLWGPFSDREIASVFRNHPLPRVVNGLIELAIEREQGHADNTTGIAMRWNEAEIQPSSLEPVFNVLWIP